MDEPELQSFHVVIRTLIYKADQTNGFQFHHNHDLDILVESCRSPEEASQRVARAITTLANKPPV